MKCGLSTSWLSSRILDGHALLDALGAAGLTGLEIDYRVSRATLEQMLPRLRRGEFTVYSVHNYCPTPPGYEGHPNVAALFNPASLDEQERKQAVEFGLKSLQTAAELGAALAVFHLGVIPMDFKMAELFTLHDAAGEDSGDFQSRIAELQAERDSRITPYLSPLLRTVEALHREAVRLGILIGVENRYRLSQIPIGAEFDILFREFAGGQLRYWHDVGHAEIFARLGLLDHERDFLERFKGQLAGMHLHDIRGFKDHLAPGMGTFDFKRLVPYLDEESLRIIEAHQPVTLEELLQGVGVLQQAGVM
ncbi:MAG TPA: TIM barrel protein [bacterium]|nr:TIM barrel protein [bacterium]HQI49576.1 TIM barrel protein [bacterium]HQJ65651.1 TIM barrel protein [bacterium]